MKLKSFIQLPVLYLMCILSTSCNSDNSEKKEIESRIEGLKLRIGTNKYQLNDRESAIKNISQLSDSFKAKYHYDSLVNIQSQQTKYLAVLEDSLKHLNDKLGSK